MSFKDVFDNGQPESRSTMFARPALVRPVKALKEARNVFGLNAHAIILDCDQAPI
jgi:hypothetical protein